VKERNETEVTVKTGIVSMLAVAAAALQLDVTAADQVRTVSVQEDQVTAWNKFAERVHQLHRSQLQGRKIEQAEEFGGYRGLPRFYRQVTYRDADSKRVLSQIQWEREQPDRIHSIEVYVYNVEGRLLRDYMAWYLPHRRNAPRATAINLYHYDDDVRGWRQFDASNERTYEKCSEWRDGKEQRTLIELSEDKLIEALAEPTKGVLASALYQRCFASLTDTAGRYLEPK
jgi:hypothetical protein